MFVVVVLLLPAASFCARPYYSADLNEDEFVDFADFSKFAANWLKAGSGLAGDFDNSGSVDTNDLTHFTLYWLQEVIYPPTAESNSVSLTQGHTISIKLEASDENDDTLDYFVINYSYQGPLTLDGNTATYTPFADYDGNDSFTFLAYDGKYESNIATISVTVLPDTDGDGLSDYDETNGTFGYVTDPCDANSDADIMPDGWELEHTNLNPTIDDGGGDVDSDGLVNADEYLAGTNPNVQDSDGDGLLDGAEAGYGANPTNPDTDNDGITDGDEVNWGLDPNNPDTDDDGVTDYIEVCYNGNCNDYNPWQGSGYFPDYDLNANSTDTDGDGRDDSWEVQYKTHGATDILDPRCNADGADNVDEDYLTNAEEYTAGTDPTNWDTDGDGAADCEELGTSYPYVYVTDPTLVDTDGDGLVDGYSHVVSIEDYPEGTSSGRDNWGYDGCIFGEISCGTNPTNPHSDSDNMPDGWEADHWNGLWGHQFNPADDAFAHPDGDYDSDNLTNLGESENVIDPWDGDTDDDNLNDGYEVNTSGTGPKDSDTDGDNLSDGYEVNTSGTNPLEYDTDGDLLPDGWEVQYGLNPNSASGDDGKDGDPDSDGATNFEELVYDTDPCNPASNPAALMEQGKQYLGVKLTVGDHSGSHSERYNLKVGSRINHQATEYGVVAYEVYPFEVGKKYEIKIEHVDSNQPEPDYDYTALVEPNDTLPEGVGFLIEDPDPNGILGEHNESTYFYAKGKTAYLTLIKVDLKICNGGNNGSEGSQVPDANEKDLGAYLLVNWDDDNENEMPDLYEDGTVTGDDDLAKIELSLLPDELNNGTLEFVKAAGTGWNIKIWDSKTKQNEVTDFSWDIATEAPPEELWLEARSASNDERDISLQLRYTLAGTTTADTVKATAVMLNLGNAVYRDNDVGWGVDPERGHAAIVYKYIGECYRDHFYNANMYYIIAMKGPSDDKTLANITDSGDPCYGCYTNTSDITYSKRLAIIKTAKELAARDIGYEALNALIPHRWDGTINSITDLRCDGLVEICYEINGIDVWAMKRVFGGISYNYDISDWTDILEYDNRVWQSGANNKNDNLEEHNDFDVGDASAWNDTLQPATQCGYVMPINARTKFSKQDLCQPVGHKGGN